jgi:hypothetical protein
MSNIPDEPLDQKSADLLPQANNDGAEHQPETVKATAKLARMKNKLQREFAEDHLGAGTVGGILDKGRGGDTRRNADVGPRIRK